MTSGGTVLVLNGTSSAGKTSLAHALQERWPGPLLEAGLDRHLTMLPRRYLGAAWPEVFGYRMSGELVAHVEPGPVGDRLARAMHRSVAALAGAGMDVVVDHVLLTSQWAFDLAAALDGVTAVLVGVRCEPPVLVEREQSRGERTLGQAQAQLPLVHAHGAYDVEVDTAVLDPGAAADAVMAWLARGGVPGALGRLRSAREPATRPPGRLA